MAKQKSEKSIMYTRKLRHRPTEIIINFILESVTLYDTKYTSSEECELPLHPSSSLQDTKIPRRIRSHEV